MPINTGTLRMNGKKQPFITLHRPSSFLPMKGDEGYYIVILLVIVCMLGTYIDKMKGEGFFSFRISNFQLFHSPIFNLFGLVRFCMHGDKIYFLLSC